MYLISGHRFSSILFRFLLLLECCADTVSGPLLLYKSLDRAGHRKLHVARCEVPSARCGSTY